MNEPLSFEEITDDPIGEAIATDDPAETKDRAPRKVRETKAKTKTPLPQWRNGQISKFATQIYESGGNALIAIGHADYGQSIVDIAEPAGAVWEKLAKRHEWLRRFFDRIMTTSEFSELIWVHFPLFMLALKDLGLLRPASFQITDEFAEEMEKEVKERRSTNAA